MTPPAPSRSPGRRRPRKKSACDRCRSLKQKCSGNSGNNIDLLDCRNTGFYISTKKKVERYLAERSSLDRIPSPQGFRAPALPLSTMTSSSDGGDTDRFSGHAPNTLLPNISPQHKALCGSHLSLENYRSRTSISTGLTRSTPTAASDLWYPVSHAMLAPHQPQPQRPATQLSWVTADLISDSNVESSSSSGLLPTAMHECRPRAPPPTQRVLEPPPISVGPPMMRDPGVAPYSVQDPSPAYARPVPGHQPGQISSYDHGMGGSGSKQRVAPYSDPTTLPEVFPAYAGGIPGRRHAEPAKDEKKTALPMQRAPYSTMQSAMPPNAAGNDLYAIPSKGWRSDYSASTEVRPESSIEGAVHNPHLSAPPTWPYHTSGSDIRHQYWTAQVAPQPIPLADTRNTMPSRFYAPTNRY